MSAAALLPFPDVAPKSPTGIANLAAECLWNEVRTWPKPGLVSHIDSGSHSDMDAQTFRCSIEAITPHFRAMALGGSLGCSMTELRAIGVEAERAMLAATGGINTHRGAIFGLGLLCAAAGARAAGLSKSSSTLGVIVARRWGQGILAESPRERSHGQQACRRYGVGGARLEAAAGFPALYAVGLPALRKGSVLSPGNAEAARLHCCFALIAALDDTNLLHRGGLSGLRFAQQSAHDFIAMGGVGRLGWREHAFAVHCDFIERRLSPGGAADLLAMSLFASEFDGSGAKS